MKKILLIEDDAILRENTAELLELSNYKVITAANGKIGVSSAAQHTPDIIVCDIMMPEMDGYGVLEALSKNKNLKNIPFIFLSAKTEREDVRRGMNMGADDYITKPFTEEELVSAVESRLAKVAILNDFKSGQMASQVSSESGKVLPSTSDLKTCFNNFGKTFEFSQGDIIYEEGHNSNYIYYIEKGLVKCHKLDEQGKELTTSLHNTADIFGYTSFVQNMPYQETASAIRDVVLLGISKEQFKLVFDQNPNIALEFVQLLTDDLHGVSDQLLQMAYSSVKRKTAKTILIFAEKLNPKPGEPIRISRTDLASVAGIATETLIRSISDLKKEGLIEIDGRNIKILDIKNLKEIY